MTTNFGRDTSCTSSLKTGRFVTGAMLVAEAAYRRLTTPRGMLRGAEEEANYGIDLAELIGNVNPKSAAAALPDRIRAELSKDERIDSVAVDVLSSVVGPATTFVITVTCQTAAGPFELQIEASAVTVELLGIKTEAA